MLHTCTTVGSGRPLSVAWSYASLHGCQNRGQLPILKKGNSFYAGCVERNTLFADQFRQSMTGRSLPLVTMCFCTPANDQMSPLLQAIHLSFCSAPRACSTW